MKLKTTIKLLACLSFAKTIYFNLKYFPLKTALYLPVIIYRKTKLYKMKGQIVLNLPPKPGIVEIGPHTLSTQDAKYARTIWAVWGKLVINGKTKFGRGSHINIGKNGTLSIGNNFSITGGSTIICEKEISFGNNCLLSWDILFLDTDYHRILNQSGDIVNNPQPIHIGNHVWIGCRSTILKGVSIPDDVVIAANSTITKSTIEKHCVIGGSGKEIAILKRDINWREY